MLKTQCLIIYDAIILVRYIFIFWLKNPMAVNDDFWSSFLNVWIVGASAIVNYVHGFLLGLKFFVRTFDTASFNLTFATCTKSHYSNPGVNIHRLAKKQLKY